MRALGVFAVLCVLGCGSRIAPDDLPEAEGPGEEPASTGGEQGPSPEPAALADGAIEDLAALHAACERASVEARPALHVVALAPRFVDPEEEGLQVDTSRNFRLFGGAAELFTSELEPIVFPASPPRADELRRQSVALRVGFFLAFDGGQPCLVRSASAVTTARIDLAYAELVDGEGSVLAREDTERFAAWRDDDVPEPGVSFEGSAEFVASARGARDALSGCFASAAHSVHLVFRVEAGDLRVALASGVEGRERECARRALDSAGVRSEGTVRFIPIP